MQSFLTALFTFRRLAKAGVRFVSKRVAPRAQGEDARRRERILNILLLGSFVLSGTATLVVFVNTLEVGDAHPGAPPVRPK